MLHSSEIIKTMRENDERIRELEKMIRDLGVSYRNCTFEDLKTRKAEFDKKLELENKYYAEIENRKIMRGILRDNARRAFFTEAMPIMVEILKKYEGKAIGPKTNDKIYKELVEKIGHGFYFHKSWCSELVFSYRDSILRHDDLTIYVKGGKDMFDDSNKLVVYPLEDYALYNCGEYVEDPVAHAEKIQNAFRDLKRMEEDFRKACSEFNKIIPSNIDHEYPNHFRSYLFSAC